MKEELDIGIFIYGTVKATAPVAGQSEKKSKKMKKHSGGAYGKSDYIIK